MDIFRNIIFIASLFLALWMTFICIGSLIQKEGIPALNIILMSISITGIITYAMGIY